MEGITTRDGIPLDVMRPVAPRDIPGLWPVIEEYIEAANEYAGGKYAPHDWLAKCLIGQADLLVYPGGKGAAICEAVQYPQKRVYVAMLLGAEGNIDWHACQAAAEAMARQRMCSCIEIYGRKGWRPLLEQQIGYEFAHWVWRKEI